MLAASHALIGASVAKLIPNPYLSLPLLIILHFLGDIFPHWDFRTRKATRSKFQTISLSLTDAGLGFLLGFWLFHNTVSLNYLLGCMFISQLPDWLESPLHVFDWNFPPFSSIKHLQSRCHSKLDLPWGLVWQILIVLIFVFISKL